MHNVRNSLSECSQYIVMEGGRAGMKHSVVTEWHFGHTNYPAVLRSRNNTAGGGMVYKSSIKASNVLIFGWSRNLLQAYLLLHERLRGYQSWIFA